MNFITVSDLHIWGPDDPLYQSLLTLLRKNVRKGDVLVLAGDIFDLFVGAKAVFVERYAEFFSALETVARSGVAVHYIEGNHDFLMKSAFTRIGVQVYDADVSITYGGKRFYISHGDLVDRSDWGYLLLRRFFRSIAMRIFVTLAPGRLVEKIGLKSSYESRKTKPILPASLPTYKLERMRKWYRNFAAQKMSEGYDFVVMGHCHDLDEMSFKIGGRTAHYANVGFPRTHGSYVIWTPGQEKLSREPL